MKVDMLKKHVYFFRGIFLVGGENMGRPKGGKNKRWTTEDRIRIVHEYVDDHISQRILAKEEGLSRSTLRGWINRYRAEGDEGLKNKKKTGNRFSALHTSKTLSTEERQQLIIEQQRIEIERLKKGYAVKGVGADKEYVSLKDVNTKS